MKAPKKTPQITLEHVMEWAFAHDKTGSKDMKIKSLLNRRISISRMEKDISRIQFGNNRATLSKADRAVLRDVIKNKKHPAVSMYCRDVLKFMNDLYRRRSTIPPPWRT